MSNFIRDIIFSTGVLGAPATIPGTVELAVLTIGALRKKRVSRREFAGPEMKARIAIVIPAHNEQSVIRSCIDSLTSCTEGSDHYEIVVIADNCTDNTASEARKAGVRVLVREDSERRGKGFALRYAFDKLKAGGFDGFLVIDADSTVSPNLLDRVAVCLSAGVQAVQCRYRVSNPETSTRTRLMDVAFLGFNVLRPRGRSSWGLSAGVLGNGFALTREVLDRVPYAATSIVEDLEYHLMLVSAKVRVEFLDEATVFGLIPGDLEAAATQRSRWEGGRFHVAIQWIPRYATMLAKRQWRVFEPLMDLLTLPLAFHTTLLTIPIVLGSRVVRGYGLFAAYVVVFHVLASINLSEDPGCAFRTLASVPQYVLWKFLSLPGILRNRSANSQWVRTERGV